MPALGSVADQPQPTNQNIGAENVAQNSDALTKLQLEQARSVAEQLLKGGLDTSPTYSPWGAIGRTALSLAGALEQNRAARGDIAATQAAGQGKIEALGALPIGDQSVTPSGPTSFQAPPGDDPLRYGAGDVPHPVASHVIGQMESSGNYGNMTDSKTRHGYAIGKYGVMEDELQDNLKAAGLPPMTVEQFRANRQAQDKVFEANFYKYPSFNDNASAWLTGKTLAESGTRHDRFGSTGMSYVTKANQMLAKELTPPAHPLSGPVDAPVTTNPASPYSNGGGPPVYHPMSFTRDQNGNFQPKPTPSGTHMIVPDPRNPSIQRAVPMNAMNPTPMAGQGALPQQGVPGYPGVATMPRPAPTTSVTGPPLPPQTFGGPRPINAPPPTPPGAQPLAAPAPAPAAPPVAQAPTQANPRPPLPQGIDPGSKEDIYGYTYVPGSMSQAQIQSAVKTARHLLSNPFTQEAGQHLLDSLTPQSKEFENGFVYTGNDMIGYNPTHRRVTPKVAQSVTGVEGPFGAGRVDVPVAPPGTQITAPTALTTTHTGREQSQQTGPTGGLYNSLGYPINPDGSIDHARMQRGDIKRQ